MTITRRFWLLSGVLLLLTLLLGAYSISTVVSLLRASRAAEAEYEVMDRANAVIGNIVWLRDSLRGVGGVDARIYRDVRFYAPIQQHVSQITDGLKTAQTRDDGDAPAERELALSTNEHVASAVSLAAGQQATEPIAMELEKARQSLEATAKLMPTSARHHVTAATVQLAGRLTWSILWLIVVLLISAAIHYLQFRTVVRPLVWLRDQMQRAAANNYREDVHAQGDREYREVAGYFNTVVRELADLYRNLEERVIAKSRELVRSERLASVGFLAAGVAHEINNPLSVISGYAELAGNALRRVLLGPDASGEDDAEAEAQALAGALEAQTIIRDEAFRCKEITSRLLSLARGGNNGRQHLQLDEVARQVTSLTKGLRNYRDRQVVLQFEDGDSLDVVANPTEMKQVLLNLIVNALEASSQTGDAVNVGGHRVGEWVEVFVEDKGKGMSREVLERIFEPFYTVKRSSNGEVGNGLGLSITHAIIENHGGAIRAESDGVGRGSRFTVRLPAAAKTNGKAERMPAEMLS